MQSKRDEFFFRKLKERYNEVWKSKGGTYESFGEALGKVSGLHSVGHQQVGKWITGKTFPDRYLPYIAEVLGVEESYFFPSTEFEKYQFDSDYMDRLGAQKDDTMKEIGLDEFFLLAVKRITSFDSDFPMYAPICPKRLPNPSVSMRDVYPDYRSGGERCISKNPDGSTTEVDEENVGVKRYTIAPTAPMSYERRELLQLERDGETYTLDPRDMLFLKEIQDKVAEYVEFLFAQRVKEMRREEAEELRYLVSHPEPGAYEYRGRITPEDLNKIDRFGNWKTDGDGGIIIYKDERSGKKWQA